MNWIDEKTEELDRLDYEGEIAVRKSGVRTAVVVFEELRTALQDAHTKGTQEAGEAEYENGMMEGTTLGKIIGTQEALAKVEEWVNEESLIAKADYVEFGEVRSQARIDALSDLLHHLQQLKDNTKTV